MIKSMFKFYAKTLLVAFFIVDLFLVALNKYAGPVVINYVNYETKKSSIEILRNTGLTNINEVLDKNDLYKVTTDSKGNVDSIDFNIPLLNELLIIVAKKTRNQLIKENSKKNVKFIPIGVVSNNVFLNNTGLKIPVKIEYKGNVGLDLKYRVKSYGIDSAVVEIYIRVEVTQVSMIPFIKKEQKIVSDIPVAIKVIKGAENGVLINKSSNYSLPIE